HFHAVDQYELLSLLGPRDGRSGAELDDTTGCRRAEYSRRYRSTGCLPDRIEIRQAGIEDFIDQHHATHIMTVGHAHDIEARRRYLEHLSVDAGSTTRVVQRLNTTIPSIDQTESVAGRSAIDQGLRGSHRRPSRCAAHPGRIHMREP